MRGKDVNPKVLITGGASGIGAALARLVVKKGGGVGIVDLNEELGFALVKELGEGAFFEPADISDEDRFEAAYQSLKTKMGGIVAAAACAGKRPKRYPIETHPVEEFRDLVDNHATGTFVSCKIIGRDFVEQGGGAIVTISSALSIRPGPMLGYTAGKAAVMNLTQSLAVHWGKKNVRINTVVPGWVDTPFIRQQESEGRDLSAIFEVTPMGRMVQPEEIAEVAWFLMQPESSAMTGSVVVADCGITLGGGWLPYGQLP